MDLITASFFLEPTIGSSPYGISWAPSGEPNQLKIVDSSNNSVFPQGFISVQGLSIPAGYQSATAETPAVWTATEPTLAGQTTYGFTIIQYSTKSGVWKNAIPIVANTGNGPLTAGTMATLWADAINLMNTTGQINATATSSGAVLTITAAAGYPIFILNQPVNGVTLNESTAGVQSLGYAIDLTAAGYTSGAQPQNFSSSGIYDKISFFYDVQLPGSAVAGSRKQRYNVILWVDTTSADYSVWKTYFLSVAQGTISGYAVAATKFL